MTGHAGFDQLWMPVYSHERMCDDELFARALHDALLALRSLPQFSAGSPDPSPKRSPPKRGAGAAAGAAGLSDLGDFAMRLLEPEPEQRFTATAALAHRWMVAEPPADHCGWG